MGRNSVRPWTTPRTMTCKMGIKASVMDGTERCQVTSPYFTPSVMGRPRLLVRLSSPTATTPRFHHQYGERRIARRVLPGPKSTAQSLFARSEEHTSELQSLRH